MNLISCENCGVVLDLSRIEKPDIEDEDGGVNRDVAAWVCGTLYRPSCARVVRAVFFIPTGEGLRRQNGNQNPNG